MACELQLDPTQGIFKVVYSSRLGKRASKPQLNLR